MVVLGRIYQSLWYKIQIYAQQKGKVTENEENWVINRTKGYLEYCLR